LAILSDPTGSIIKKAFSDSFELVPSEVNAEFALEQLGTSLLPIDSNGLIFSAFFSQSFTLSRLSLAGEIGTMLVDVNNFFDFLDNFLFDKFSPSESWDFFFFEAFISFVDFNKSQNLNEKILFNILKAIITSLVLRFLFC
jgi:hypothetical protein